MQSAPPGAQSDCSGSQSSAAAPRLHGTSDGADATAADAAAVSATLIKHLWIAPSKWCDVSTVYLLSCRPLGHVTVALHP